MKRLRVSLLVLGIMSALVAGCAPKPSPPAAEDSPTALEQLLEIIDLPRQTLVFKPTRDDITVGRVVFSVYCSHPDDVRVNGMRPDPAWRDVHLTETGEIVVDERNSAVPEIAWLYIYLSEVAKNQFELGPLKIEVSGNQQNVLLCLSIKVWFNEVTNQYDGLYYENLDDRYALVSYCSDAPEPSPVEARFRQNRVATVNEFKEAISGPLVIRLNQRPLREEWSR
jgi:hypothetical protein